MHPSLTIRRRRPSRYILGAWRYHRCRHRAGQGVAWPDVLCGVEHDAIEQGVEADEAKRIGASQLNSSVGPTAVANTRTRLTTVLSGTIRCIANAI
jgi:hypothetical protein